MEEEKLLTEELQLAEQMKQSYCKVSVGEQLMETDPEKSAEMLYKIALIHKQRSPDKVSLIRCVGLLNAAILRNPSNICQIKIDLIDVCKHTLEQANANNRNADLVAKANAVKVEINQLRHDVDDFLKQIDAQTKTGDLRELQVRKAELVQRINKAIASKYKEVMADISKFCFNIMGKPPCKYSIAAMGSLARNEITPYSDFEHIILLSDDENYEQHLEYFRWYSVVFHVIVLNLQESIIPSLNIKSLSWFFDAHTPRGVSFDGMMPHACKFPLGRFEKTEKKPFVTELIKPVGEMLKYLSSEEDLKNGYHLADILMKTCFVFGNKNIFDQFVNGVKTYLSSKSKQERINEVEQQVRDDLDKFSARFRLANLKSQDTINIKQLVYRSSTLFVAALASIHNISESSCFDIIQTMANRNIISQTTKVKLSYAVSIACEMRLKVYMEKKSQCDNPIELNKNDESIKEFLSIVGAKNTINYFQIAYCLQREVAKQLNFTKLHFYSNPLLINIVIGMAFGMELSHTISKIFLEFVWSVKDFDFDDCIKKLETKYFFNHAIIKNDSQSNKRLIVSLADQLFKENIFDEALELYQHILVGFNKETNETNTNRKTAWIYLKIGFCLTRLQKWSDIAKNFHIAIELLQLTCLDQETDEELAFAFNKFGSALAKIYQYNDALIYLKKSLKIHHKVLGTCNFRKNDNAANILNDIGNCLTKMQRYDDALIHLKQSLEIYENVSLDPRKDGNVAMTHNNIGGCLMEMQQYEDALIHLKQSLEIKKNISLNPEKDGNVATSLNNIGNCLKGMQQYNEALIHLKQSLEIMKTISLNPKKDGNVAMTHDNIGCCLRDIHHYDDALIHLKQSLEIYKNISLNSSKDGKVAMNLSTIGGCFMDMHHYEDALIYLKQSLEIYKNISINLKKDGNVASTLNKIGSCLMEMHHYEDALIHLKQSLKIYKNISLNPRKDCNVAMTLNNIGGCFMEMQHYDDALIHLKQSLKIYKNISLNLRKDCNVAMTLNNTGKCLMNMQQYDDALIHLKQSLEIYKNISLNLRKDGNVAMNLNIIGSCLIEMHHYDDALIHLKQSLQISKNISLNPKKDSKVAINLNIIGSCLMDMHHHDDALIHLKQSLEIYKNISLNPRKDGKVAMNLNNIGGCFMNMHHYDDALIHFKQSLEIHKNISLNLKKDGNVASTLNNIGSCLMEMHHYDNALIHLKQSLEIKKNISLNPKKDGNLAMTLKNIGKCLMGMHHNDDALIHLK